MKQNYEYQGHETQPDHGLRRIMMGARCLNPTTGRMDGVDNFASTAPQWSSYRFAFNNPVMYTDPDGNLERTIYNSSTDDEPPTFNNGFREVSFRAAAYSVGFVDLSGSGGGAGEYRLRAGSEEIGVIHQYKGDPYNKKVFYNDYLEWVPREGPSIGPALPGIRGIRFRQANPLASYWSNVFNRANDGVGGLGTGLSSLGGTFRLSRGADISFKHYATGWGGGSRGNISTYSTAKWGSRLNRASVGVTSIFGMYDIGTNAFKEGGIGPGTQKAVGRTSGSLLFGSSAAYAGAGFGSLFGGIGALPGGIIGGLLGGYGGSIIGENTVEYIQQKP